MLAEFLKVSANFGWRRLVLSMRSRLAFSLAGLLLIALGWVGWNRVAGEGSLGYAILSSRSEEFSGHVYDIDTGRRVSGQVVYLRTHGRDVARGKGFKTESYLDTTDAEGRFGIKYRKLASFTNGAVISPTYGPMPLRIIPEGTLAIPLARLDEDVDEVLASSIRGPSMSQADTVFLDLGEISTRVTGDSADIAVSVIEDLRPRLVVTALGAGGLVRRDLGPQMSVIDSLGVYCQAPENGYRQSDVVEVTVDRSVYFVRLRDGKRYARVLFHPKAMFQRTRADGRVKLSCTVWVNQAGGRGLCGPDPFTRELLSVADKSVRGILRGTTERARSRGRVTPSHHE
jgi:hypothetical protein